MIVTRHFVFIHMHKTGGQTLNDIIQRSFGGHRMVGYHFPASETPQENTDLPLVSMVRNPWDWYVSWYAFNNRPNMRNPLFTAVSDNGQADFKSTLANLVNLGSDDRESTRRRDELTDLLPETLDNNRGVGLTKDAIRQFSDNDTGYFSWLFARMLEVEDDREIHIGKFENLQDDFLSIMEKVGVQQLETLKTELDKRERKNYSHHSHYSHYYDNELRDLVGRKESELIARFGYQFEVVGPAGEAAGSGSHSSLVGSREFRKLLGRANNYLLLQRDFDIDAIKNKIAQIPEEKWLESERERRFDVHRDTQALLLIHFEDYKYKKPEYRELFYELEDELKPLIDHIAAYYQDNGFVVRLIFAKLRAGGVIPKHADGGFSLLNCHRVHIPIITNEENIFSVSGEEKIMRVGELWEIDNALVHTVENRSEEDRIHLIIDWMPNENGRSEEAVLTEDPSDGVVDQRGDLATLNAMVGEAYQIYQSGQTRRAESIYLQVLDVDVHHVLCNNLLGLLCLQQNRPEEAEKYIRKALDFKPKDAQAQSNLGLALKDLGRLEEAAAHFRQALLLSPNNPKLHNNLGNIFRQLDRLDDAIASYEKAIVIQPAYGEGLHNLGSALVSAGRFVDAVKVLQRSLAVRPDFAATQAELDRAMTGLGMSKTTEREQ